MKTITIILSCFFFNSFALAQNHLQMDESTIFAYNVVCANSQDFQKNSLQYTEVEQANAVEGRKDLKELIQFSEANVLQAIEEGELGAAAMTCAIVDEITQGFRLDCYADNDEKIDLSKSQEACQSLINSYN